MARPRLLIFVIAYYADTTLKRVLERIPGEIFRHFEVEILVVDDASEDRTFEIGQEYKQAHPEMRVTVLRNEYNQGYGGNQKVGYTYAIAEGFDFVAMVHGDGQYAPEELPRLTAPLLEGRADVVFGSRMMERFGALRGGMPFYKFIGNALLTHAQNKLLGTTFAEFHSGYRVYAVKTLARVPFRLNSNEFHFDTEIIIQLLNANARILELPVPTFYGDEICRVNGLKYAKDVMVATVQNALHRLGIFYQRRFDTEGPLEATRSEAKLGFASSHQWAVEAVEAGRRVLDLGASPPALSAAVRRKGCEFAIADRTSPPVRAPGTTVYLQDLDDELSAPVEQYDTLLLLDILEHLKSPEQFLGRLRAKLDHRPRAVILSTPNIAFAPVRAMLLLGQFNYGRYGVLAMTHTRLFTFRTIRRLLTDEGFRITRTRGVPAPFPKVLGDGLLGRGAVAANLALIRVSKTLFSYQIFIEAETTPDVDFVLANTKKTSAARASTPRR